MKPITIYLDSCDYDLIKATAPSSRFFFQKCSTMFEQTDVPFTQVAILFTPNRLTRRPMVAMLKELICAVADGNEHREVLCAIIYKFLFYLG